MSVATCTHAKDSAVRQWIADGIALLAAKRIGAYSGYLSPHDEPEQPPQEREPSTASLEQLFACISVTIKLRSPANMLSAHTQRGLATRT